MFPEVAPLCRGSRLASASPVGSIRHCGHRSLKKKPTASALMLMISHAVHLLLCVSALDGSWCCCVTAQGVRIQSKVGWCCASKLTGNPSKKLTVFHMNRVQAAAWPKLVQIRNLIRFLHYSARFSISRSRCANVQMPTAQPVCNLFITNQICTITQRIVKACTVLLPER